MKIIHTAAVAAIVISASSVARADVAADKAAIRRTYESVVTLMLRGDMAKARAYTTSDFKMRTIDGQVLSWPQLAQAFKAGMKMGQYKALPNRYLSMQVRGGRATVVVSGGAIIRMRDAKGKLDIVRSTVKTRDQWVKSGGVWKERFSEQLSEETRINGTLVTRNGKVVLKM